MNIAGIEVGTGQPVRLIAEFGSCHGGSLDRAKRLIDTAAEAGADFVKGQYWSSADVMVERRHNDWPEYQRSAMPSWWLTPLMKHAESAGIPLFFSVFSPDDVRVLEDVGVPAYKIASAELPYIPLLEAVAKTGKPVLLSTGMAGYDDLYPAIECIPYEQMAMLHCVASYPAPPEDMNLTCARTITCGWTFPWGLSDHTAEPFAAPLMAAALGAVIVEKHYKLLDSTGPDADFAIYPVELKALATALHSAHLLLAGNGMKRVMPSEEANLSDRRSVHADGRWLRG